MIFRLNIFLCKARNNGWCINRFPCSVFGQAEHSVFVIFDGHGVEGKNIIKVNSGLVKNNERNTTSVHPSEANG